MSPLGLWLLVALFGLQSGWQVKAAPFETVALTNTISSATYPTPQMSKRLAVGSSLLASTSSMTTSSSSVVTSHSLPLAQWFLDQVAVASLDNTSLTTTCSSSCSFFSSGIYNISTTTATLNGPQIGDYVCSIVGWAQDCAVCVGGMACLEAYDSLVIQCLQEGLITLSSTVQVLLPTPTPYITTTTSTNPSSTLLPFQTKSTSLATFASLLSAWIVFPNNTFAAGLGLGLDDTITSGSSNGAGILNAQVLASQSQAPTATSLHPSIAMANAITAPSSSGSQTTTTNSSSVADQQDMNMNCSTLLNLAMTNQTALQALNASLPSPTDLGQAIALCNGGTSSVISGAGAGGSQTTLADPLITGAGNTTTTILQPSSSSSSVISTNNTTVMAQADTASNILSSSATQRIKPLKLQFQGRGMRFDASAFLTIVWVASWSQ